MAEAGKILSPPAGRQKERPDQRLNVIGTRMLRKEDPRFLIGRGHFIDDLELPNMAHAAALRSPHAHARIKSIDASAARALPGVICVITGEEAAQRNATHCHVLPTLLSSSAVWRSGKSAISASRWR